MCLPTTWQRTCMWKACSLLQKLHPKTICTCHYGDKGDHCLCWNLWYQWLHLTSSRVRSMLRVLRLFHSLGDSSFPCYPARCKRPEQGALRGGRGLPISELEPHSWRLWWLEQKLCLDTIQEASQCGQKISKTICFWQCALLHRWTVTFCSIWNIFSMHDFLS